MKTRIKRKVISQSGESIAETLISLLISSLALIMLAGAINTTTRIVNTGQRQIEKFYTANNALLEKDTTNEYVHSGSEDGSKDGASFTLKIKEGLDAGKKYGEYKKIYYYYQNAFPGKNIIIYSK